MQILLTATAVHVNGARKCPQADKSIDGQEMVDMQSAMQASQTECLNCAGAGHDSVDCPALVHVPRANVLQMAVEKKRINQGGTLWNRMWDQVLDWVEHENRTLNRQSFRSIFSSS